MTKKELIDALKNYPEDAPVVLITNDAKFDGQKIDFIKDLRELYIKQVDLKSAVVEMENMAGLRCFKAVDPDEQTDKFVHKIITLGS